MKDAFLDLNFLAAWIAPSFPIDIMSFPFEARMLILYHTGRYGQNSSYRSMNQYRNTFKMYYSRYRPIPDNTGRIGVYRTFRPEKRNSAGTKTERKNRRNAWFEQTPVQQVATTLTSPIRSSSSFVFFFFSSVVLLHCSDFFSFFAEQWTLLCGISFFVLCYLKFLKPFYTWLALEMLKTYIFLIKDGLNGSAFYLLFSFEPHVMW